MLEYKYKQKLKLGSDIWKPFIFFTSEKCIKAIEKARSCHAVGTRERWEEHSILLFRERDRPSGQKLMGGDTLLWKPWHTQVIWETERSILLLFDDSKISYKYFSQYI